MDGTVDFPESGQREIARPASQAALVNGVEMAEMNDRGSGQTGFLWSNLDSHRKSSHSKITCDNRHNSQLARSVPHIILNNQRWMRSSHLTSPGHREIDEIDLASPWIHLTAPLLDLAW